MIAQSDNNSTPSPMPDNGRGENGRFAKGHKFAKGNPHAKRVNELRSALIKAVTPKDIADVIKALLKKAKKGDVFAAKEFLDRTIGKATPTEDMSIQVGEGKEAVYVKIVRGVSMDEL